MDKIKFKDFYRVPNIKFDIPKLRESLEKILEKKFLIHWVLKILAQYH